MNTNFLCHSCKVVFPSWFWNYLTPHQTKQNRKRCRAHNPVYKGEKTNYQQINIWKVFILAPNKITQRETRKKFHYVPMFIRLWENSSQNWWKFKLIPLLEKKNPVI